MPVTICPACDEDVRLTSKPRLGQIVNCSRCGARLEVVSVNPIELDWAEDDFDAEEEEDLDDDEFSEEEEDDDLLDDEDDDLFDDEEEDES